MSRTDEAVIRVAGLATCLGGRWVHRDLNLVARQGEVLAVVGPSGNGKSALLHRVVGLSRPDGGRVEVLGIDVHHADDATARNLRQRWGILFQNNALFSAFTVFENVAFPLRELNRYGHALDEALIEDLVWSKLTMVDMEPEDVWKRPAQLSGGMAKRAALARALVLEAELLFLDEPTAGLDPILARELNALIRRIHQEQALSALLISHDVETIAVLADRVAVLDNGHIVANETLEALVHLEHPFVRELFASAPGQLRLSRIGHGYA